MRLIFAVLPFCAMVADSLNSRHALSVVALQGETHHVQGIEVDQETVWVSSVDTRGKRGLLFLFDRQTGRMLRSAEVQSGERLHPGGISLDGKSIWVPVAEYRRSSTTNVQKRDRRTLVLQAEFTVEDHIGAVVVVPQGLAGVNWEAREFYVWTRAGKLQRRTSNPTGVAIQDMKFTSGMLVAGGLLRDGGGVVVWLDWPSLKELRRIQADRTDRGVALTHEGLAVQGSTLYLLPEDGPSRLFTFRLPWSRD